MTLLGISGSLRAASRSTALLHEAARLAEGTTISVWSALGDVPPFNEDHEETPAPVVDELRARVRAATGLVVVTPEYSGSVPGQLKNALDWAARPHADHVLRGTPVLVLSASPGRYGAAWAARALGDVLRSAGARVGAESFGLPHAHEAFDDAGRLRDPRDHRRLAAVVNGFLAQIAGLDDRFHGVAGREPAAAC